MVRPDEMDDVLEKLSLLAPTEADQPLPAQQALAAIERRARHNQITHDEPLSGRFMLMFRRKYALALAALVVLVALAFSFEPVRVAASDFLGLFRVQKFAAVSISPEQLQLLENLSEQGLQPGALEMIQEPGPPQAVASLAEAEATTGEAVRVPAALPPADTIYVTSGGNGRLTVDLQSARAIVSAAGADPALLPDTLDNADVAVTLYPAVQQEWAYGVTLMQSRSPEVDYPPDVDPAILGQAMLEVLGVAPDQARRLANTIDWSSTVLLPVPENLATFSEVPVAGGSGLLLSSIDGRGNSLMWQDGGTIYFLVAESRSRDELLEIANSLD